MTSTPLEVLRTMIELAVRFVTLVPARSTLSRGRTRRPGALVFVIEAP